MSDLPPREEVTLRWTLEREDFVEGIAPFILRRMRHPALLVVQLGVGLLAVVLVMNGVGGWPPAPDTVPILIVVFLASVAVLLLLDWPIATLIAGRQWQGSSRLRGPQEAVLMPKEIRLREAEMHSTLRWSAFDQVSETSRLYRLHIGGQRSPRMFVLIPKRALSGPDGSGELGALLRRHVAAGAELAERPPSGAAT